MTSRRSLAKQHYCTVDALLEAALATAYDNIQMDGFLASESRSAEHGSPVWLKRGICILWLLLRTQETSTWKPKTTLGLTTL